MKNKLITRPAKQKDVNKIQKFIKLYYKKKHIFSKNKKFFNWLYKHIDGKINCTLALKNNNIVGIFSYIPLEKFDKKLSKNGHIFGSFWTVKGTKMSKVPPAYEEAEKPNVIINTNKESVSIALKIFWNLHHSFKPKLIFAIGVGPRWYRYHKIKKFKLVASNHHFIISPNIRKTNIIKNFIFSKKNIINRKNKPKIKFKKIYRTNELKKLPINNLFNYQIPTKSKIYLVNRYLKHPIYKYYIYTIAKKKIISLCIFRIVKIKNTRIIRFVDYIGSNKSFTVLRSFFLEILQKYEAEYLDFYSYGIPLNILKKAGLLNKKKYNKLIIPDYFEPFVNKNIGITIGYKRYNINGKIRIFKADGDQDRPNYYLKN